MMNFEEEAFWQDHTYSPKGKQTADRGNVVAVCASFSVKNNRVRSSEFCQQLLCCLATFTSQPLIGHKPKLIHNEHLLKDPKKLYNQLQRAYCSAHYNNN